MAEKKVDKKLKALYGANFPGFELPSKFPDKDLGEKFAAWIQAKWDEQQKSMRDKRLHWSRHRHFKQGNQWISSRDGRTWHEPRHDENTIRAVLNLIGPALDYRLGVLREQRPGFRQEPLGTTVEAKEQAQAQQIVVEYYFHVLTAWLVFGDAFQAAQTDGCSFIHIFKDRFKGPKKERVKVIAPGTPRFAALRDQGYEERNDGNLVIPLDESGNERAKGETAAQFRTGDIAHRVVYAYETVADPEAKTINGPYDKAKWFIIRRTRDLETAKIETGITDLSADTKGETSDPLDQEPASVAMQWNRGLPAYPTHRRGEKEGVYEYLLFFGAGEEDAIKKGAWRRVIGGRLLGGENSLPGGKIPLAQIRDGSSDPELYPRPSMADWIGDQIAINSLISMLLTHARLLGGGRVLTQKDTQIEESFSSIVGSLVEYSGIKPDFLTPPRVSGDVWTLIEFLIKKLEDKHGWNDLARGQVSGTGSFQDVSGRAVLGARELFERTLGPMVRASSDGVTSWAELIVVYAQHLFDEARLIPVLGGRPDLAKRIDRASLGERPVVFSDPETLVPLPRALRNEMLFDLFEKGIITLDEYKKRAPFALIRDVFSGSQSQFARAQSINEVLIERWEELRPMLDQDPLAVYQPEAGVPVLWDDDPAVHSNVLLELILDDRKPWGLRELALSRRSVYEDMAKAKLGGQVDPQTGQPLPPAPVPIEVIGAPADLPRGPAQGPPQIPQLPEQPPSPTGEVPGALGAAGPAAAPELAPQAPPPELAAQPLGSFGAIEEGLEV